MAEAAAAAAAADIRGSSSAEGSAAAAAGSDHFVQLLLALLSDCAAEAEAEVCSRRLLAAGRLLSAGGGLGEHLRQLAVSLELTAPLQQLHRDAARAEVLRALAAEVAQLLRE